MTVRQLLSNLDSNELTDWMGYFRLIESRKDGKQSEPQDVGEALKRQFGFYGR
jgi:hypothetical protein